MVCGEQRHRCCAFLINPPWILSLSPCFLKKKLNTYGVESPCECLPRVGSFLANPGLSKEQLVPSCVVRTFAFVDSFLVFNFFCWNSEYKLRIHSYSKNTQHRWRCSLAYICRQGNSLRSPTLPYKERNPVGFTLLLNHITIRNNKNHIGVNFSFKRKSGAKDVCKLTNPIAFCFW